MLILLLIAAALRLYFAWLNRFCVNLDFPVVALAAKHIAEGKEFPLFLYGQGYLGTLEPIISAVFCRLLGTSEFAVSLGTILCSFFMLPVVYLWASDLGGRTAGLWALSICIVTPTLVSGYSVISVGGYAATLSIIPAVLWLACRAAAEEGSGTSIGPYVGIGLLGGLGWWTFPLILPALLTAALVILFSGRARSLPKKAAAGLFFFFVGSAPFWYWNALNGWQTFTLGRSFSEGDGVSNLLTIFMTRLPGLFGWEAYPPFARATAMLVLLAAVVYFFTASPPAKELSGRKFRSGAVVAATFLVLHLAFLSLSHFGGLNTSRYLLPIFPVAAVVLGVAAANLARRLSLAAALAAVLFFNLPQFNTIAVWQERSAREAVAQAAAAAVGDLLEETGAGAAYISYHEYELNFALRERFSFSELHGDRYEPYFIAAEESRAPVILGDLGGFEAFLRQTGGKARASPLPAPYGVARHGYTPPSPRGFVLPEECVTKVRDQSGRDVTDIVTGLDGATAWSSAGQTGAYLEIDFCRPVPLTALRLWNADERLYPEEWLLEGKAPGAMEWTRLTGTNQRNYYFWSGDRPYWGGETYRLQAGFAPRLLEAVRFSGRSGSGRSWSAASLQFLYSRRRESGSGDREGLAAVSDYIRERGITALYADRWPTNVLAGMTGGEVRFADHTGEGLPGRMLPARVVLGNDTAFLLREGEEKVFRRLLRDRRIRMGERKFGTWTLFSFAPGAWPSSWEELAGLHWTGYGALKRYHKRYAQRLYLEAMASKAEGRERAELLDAALEAYGDHGPARAARRSGHDREPERPALRTAVTFRGGIELDGVTAEPLAVRAGEKIHVRLFWKVAEDSHPERHFAFLHFRNDDIAFQDDHVLLGDLREREDGSYQPFPEVFVEHRDIAVPSGTIPGSYEIAAGLVQRGTDKRVPVRTALPHRNRAVRLPVRVTVLR